MTEEPTEDAGETEVVEETPVEEPATVEEVAEDIEEVEEEVEVELCELPWLIDYGDGEEAKPADAVAPQDHKECKY